MMQMTDNIPFLKIRPLKEYLYQKGKRLMTDCRKDSPGSFFNPKVDFDRVHLYY